MLSPRDYVDDQLGPGLVFPYDDTARRLDLWLTDAAGSTSLAEQVDLIRQLAEAVHYAHGNGVVHRNLNPTAITVTESRGGTLS